MAATDKKKRTRRTASELGLSGSERAEAERFAETLRLLLIQHERCLAVFERTLNYLRTRGHVPLSRDQIKDALKPVKVPRETPEFLNHAELA